MSTPDYNKPSLTLHTSASVEHEPSRVEQALANLIGEAGRFAVGAEESFQRTKFAAFDLRDAVWEQSGPAMVPNFARTDEERGGAGGMIEAMASRPQSGDISTAWDKVAAWHLHPSVTETARQLHRHLATANRSAQWLNEAYELCQRLGDAAYALRDTAPLPPADARLLADLVEKPTEEVPE